MIVNVQIIQKQSTTRGRLISFHCNRNRDKQQLCTEIILFQAIKAKALL